MFRGTTARSVLTAFAAALLALLFFAPSGTFTPAHTLSEATAKAETGTASSEQPVSDEAGMTRASGSRCAQEHPLIAGRATGAGTPGTPAAVDRRAPRPCRAHTPAALQVFRC
ncbi:hypothetical protein A6P39_011560 [Streptomyces sp. FXJ1.172]|uniref:hypothetical protein n=1 Tax=Streptomyces sp. FXJ1.172 TaxID=710705 RepID=UPI0007CFAABF|nr:hypothetical protein [Streptomyces sp. FXJ1.172]WEO94591.1 hypothetical protein A6P39_011560 [Streptomyces sp. FXJ1.172]